jgi:hypothetical protein
MTAAAILIGIETGFNAAALVVVDVAPISPA